jgi:Protein of unknown function (DUF998)
LGAGVLAGFRFHGSALGARPGQRSNTNVILSRPEEGPHGAPPERQPDSPLEGTQPRSVLGSRLVLAASLGPVLWIIGAVVSGLRRDEYSFRKQAISELGVGADAWLLNLSLVSPASR